MKRISQRTINVLSVIAVIACYSGTLYALMIDKFALPPDIGTFVGIYFFLYFVALIPSVVVNLISCLVYRSWTARKVYFSDVFQLVGYGIGIMLLLYSVRITGTAPQNLQYYPPAVLAFVFTALSVVIRNFFRNTSS